MSSGEACAHLFHFTGTKAGMNGVDRRSVQQIIYEASKDSAYFRNQQRQAQRVSRKLAEAKEKLDGLSQQEIEKETERAQALAAELYCELSTDRTWICVDMDMFFAAVAMRDNPSLVGKPVAVGGMTMISTANYKAREFGVRSAMPGFIAKKLCPDLIFVNLEFSKYEEIAQQIREIFAEYDPNFTSYSLDEASLDVTDYISAHFGPDDVAAGEKISSEIRRRIFELTKLTASAGIASNRMLAKICSDINKPNGQYSLGRTVEDIMSFVRTLPVRKIPGIGRVTERILKELGVETCGDVPCRMAHLQRVFTRHHVEWLQRVTLGIGSVRKQPAAPRKSVSISRTFGSLSDPAGLEAKLRELAHKLALRLQQEEEWSGRTLTLTMKSTDFRVRSRSITLPFAIRSAEQMIEHALKILRDHLPMSLRLMGLKLSSNDSSRALDPKQRTLSSFMKTTNEQQQNNGDDDDDELMSDSSCSSLEESVTFASIKKRLYYKNNRSNDSC